MVEKGIRAGKRIIREMGPSMKREYCQILPKVTQQYIREMQEELNRRNPDPTAIAALSNEMTVTERLRTFCGPEGRGGNPIRRDRYEDRRGY